MKITSKQFAEFMVKFFNGKYPNQRLGQAFCNEFLAKGGWSDPNLFYTDNFVWACEVIATEYVEG